MGRRGPSEGASGQSRLLNGWFVKALGISLLMQLVVHAVRPAVSYRALALGADAAQLGMIAAGFALLSLFVAIPIGRMIDRRGAMPFVIVGIFLVSVVAFVLVRADSIWALFVTQAVLGLGQLLTTVGVQSLIASSDPASRDSRFATFTAMVSLGQLAGPLASGFVTEHVSTPDVVSWGRGTDLVGSSVFLAAGAAGFAGFLLALSARHAGSTPRGTERSPASESSTLGSVARVLRQPSTPHAMFASIAVLATTDLLVAYLPAYGESAGLSPTIVGALLSVRACASLVSRILMGPLTRRFGHRRLLTMSTTLPALVIAPVPLLDTPAFLFASMVLAGLGLGLGQPVSLAWIARAAPESMKGTAMGVRLSGNRFGQVAIPALVGGLVGAAGLGAVFVSLSAMLASSALLTARGTFPSGEK